MQNTFKPEELITKNGKSYPVVGARLRVAHEENEHLEINTDVISFEAMDQAVVKAIIKSDKGQFSAYGAASASKDTRLIDSLLELAETRAIARALRFAGYGVEYTGIEEIGETRVGVQQTSHHSIVEVKASTARAHDFIPMTPPQRRAIQAISRANHWNPVEAARRIVRREDIQELDDLSKQDAVQIISRFKEQMAA